jgi:hypothetical protein
VTGKPGAANSSTVYVPNPSLVQQYATRYNWKKENLTEVLSKFGPLNEAGQEQLIKNLVQALGPYQLAVMTVERVTPSQQRNQLKAIKKATNSLLQQLKQAEPKWWLTATGILLTGRDEATVNAELKIASDCVADDIRALEDLHRRAKTAIPTVSKLIAQGRGGSRHRPAAKGQLIKHAIAIYSHMRAQHPASGARPGFGRPMLRFVTAVGRLFGSDLQETEIYEVWRVWKSKQKKS